MAVFELVIALLLIGAVLSGVARRFSLPYPALLALTGVALALTPNTPSVALDPQLALALFVAPVLLDAAFDSSPRDLRANWRPVTSMALAAVGLTVIAVAVVSRVVVPDLPWAAAVTLGAIVAPPDAAAATAVMKQLRPPHRLMVILEGESLFNDASALLIYRMAAAAALTGTFSFVRVIPTLVLVCLGSVLLAAVLVRVIVKLNEMVRDIATAVILQFIGTFAVWLLAEALHLSGIITIVVFAIMAARRSRIRARVRVASYAVWEVVVYVLNVLAFILVGLQLKPIISHLTARQLRSYLATAAAVVAAVVLVRLAWVMCHALLGRWIGVPAQQSGRRWPTATDWRSAVVVGWSGMRGIVTLAAALALPETFPQRGLILFVSFAVVLGTLVIQGSTISPLIRFLGLEDDGAVTREIRLAREELARAALAEIGDVPVDDGASLLKRKLEERLERAKELNTQTAASDVTNASAPSSAPSRYLDLLARTQRAERQTLVALRARGAIGDDAFHRVEEELDWAELNAEGMARTD
jgi:CPA1 family monovalent cation:H+ antiporter